MMYRIKDKWIDYNLSDKIICARIDKTKPLKKLNWCTNNESGGNTTVMYTTTDNKKAVGYIDSDMLEEWE